MIKGCDVSHYQGIIQWKKANDDIAFAILKCTEGLALKDAKFETYKKEAREAGVLLGYYHFARANDAKKEADFFIKSVGEMQEGEFLCLDWEIEFSDPVGWCKTFLDRCQEKTGIKPLIYMSSSRTTRFDWSKVIKASYGLWVARYPANDDGKTHLDPMIGKWPFCAIYQWSSKGTVKGIVGNVDMDEAYMSLDTLKKYGKPAEVIPVVEVKPPVVPVVAPNVEQPKVEIAPAPVVEAPVEQVVAPVVETPAQPQIEEIVAPVANVWEASVQPEVTQEEVNVVIKFLRKIWHLIFK